VPEDIPEFSLKFLNLKQSEQSANRSLQELLKKSMLDTEEDHYFASTALAMIGSSSEV